MDMPKDIELKIEIGEGWVGYVYTSPKGKTVRRVFSDEEFNTMPLRKFRLAILDTIDDIQEARARGVI